MVPAAFIILFLSPTKMWSHSRSRSLSEAKQISADFYVNLRMTSTLKREQADHEYILNVGYKEW